MRHAVIAVLVTTTMLAVGVVAAQAVGITRDDSRGPANSGGASPLAVPQATTTSVSPTPSYMPFPVSQTYQSVQPCRIVDTRLHKDPLNAGATRSFAVSGTTGFTAQGGHAGGCGIPSTAMAVAMTVTAFTPSATGNLTAWPVGAARPTASILNFTKGITASAGQTVQITPGASPALSVHAAKARANIVIDVYGYYEPQMHLVILADGTVWYGNSTQVTRVIHSTGSGTYVLTFDRSATGCNLLVTDNGDVNVRAVAGWGGTALTVNTYQLSAGTYVHQDESFQVFMAC